MIESRVEFLEHSLGASLPKEYVAFLDSHTSEDQPGLVVGSNPEYFGVRCLFEIVEGGGPNQVDAIYRLTSDVLPPHALPIGEDWGGNFYCLMCGGPNSGQVVWWNHERLPDDFGVVNVSSSFTEFLSGLVRTVDEP